MMRGFLNLNQITWKPNPRFHTNFFSQGQRNLANEANQTKTTKRSEPRKKSSMEYSSNTVKASILASNLSREGKYAKAVEVFDNVLKSGKEPNMVMVINMTDAAGHAGDLERVRQAVRLFEGMGKVDPNAWDSVIEAFMRNKDHLGAVRAFKQCQQLGIHWTTKMHRTFFSFFYREFEFPEGCRVTKLETAEYKERQLTATEAEDLAEFLFNYETALRGGFQPKPRPVPGVVTTRGRRK